MQLKGVAALLEADTSKLLGLNEDQKKKLIQPLKDYFGGDISGKTIAIWGLAFKPYTDDIREAPALENITTLLSEGAKVQAYDPEAMENVKGIFGDRITFSENQYAALESADALMIMTEWPVFRTPEFDKVIDLLNNKLILDGRNLYDLNQMEELEIEYHSVGRRVVG